MPKYWDDPLPAGDVDPGYAAYVEYRTTFVEQHGRYPLSYRFKPMQKIVMAAVDPVIARILGLYFVDTTAAPDLQYDYRIVAHHVEFGHEYCAEVHDVGSATATPLPQPAFVNADAVATGAEYRLRGKVPGLRPPLSGRQEIVSSSRPLESDST